MHKTALRLLLLLCISLRSMAQMAPPPPPIIGPLRVSLITCGPGDEEIWEVFGHTAVRVIDSAYPYDVVFNYGTFEFGPNFELQFMRGKLLYNVSVSSYKDFQQEYIDAKRSVEEQVLLLTTDQKTEIVRFLQKNSLPANRYYKYDFFFDNCATRIRDIFPRTLGSGFVWGRTMPVGSRITFRDIMNRYFFRDHWTRVGCNLLLGSRIDKPMSNEDIMFLPDYLRDGLKDATLNGQKIAAPAVLILPAGEQPKLGINQPFIVFCLVALLTILGLSVRRLHIIGRIMSTLLLAVTGLLGVLILIMWFGTDHQGCTNNFNILWCLPTNLVLVFARPKGSARYAVLAILLLITSVVLHLVKVQGLALLEMSPLLFSLLLVYGSVYRNSRIKPVQNA